MIEPTESFYFRHDSQKNPSYDIFIKKNEKVNGHNLIGKIDNL